MTPDAPKALRALARPGTVLGAVGARYAVIRGADRRGRALAWLEPGCVAALEAEGAITRTENGFSLTPAGRAKALRETAAEKGHDGFQTQHGPIAASAAALADGEIVSVARRAAAPALERLLQLGVKQGKPVFSRAEQVGARRLREDWARGGANGARGIDLAAPRVNSGARAPGEAAEAAMAAGLDARRRVHRAMQALSPGERSLVVEICLHDEPLAQVGARRRLAPPDLLAQLKAALARVSAAYGAR